jgi:hypothetical protein
VVHKELDSSGKFAEEASSLSSITSACSQSDNPLDKGFTGFLYSYPIHFPE